MFKHYRQIKNNFCTFFAISNWLMLDILRTHKTVDLSPWQLIKVFFKKRGYLQVFRSLFWSFHDIIAVQPEITVIIDDKEVTVRLRELQAVEYKKTIGKYSMLATIGSHAVVVASEMGEMVTIVDSQSKRQFRTVWKKTLGNKFYIIKYEIL